MTKKIKFPLEMEKGVKVRTLEELKEHFSLEKILEYYLDGKLTTWLRNGNYENEAVQISNLDRNDEDFNKKLCDTLNTNYVSHHDINVIELEERLKKTSQIKMYTVDEDIIKNINSIAFSQEELDKLLCNDINTIYICGNEFTIPLDKENTSYIGINSPRKPGIKLTEKIDIDFDKKNISFINIHLTSQSEIKIMARKSREVTMDKKIKTSFNFKKLVATFDIRKNDYWYNKKIFLFKDLLIIYDRWSFNIININTKETLVSFEDIKPPFIVFKEQSIEGLSIYKNYLIIFWGQNENSTLQLFNLNHLKIEKDIDLPYDYNRNVTGNVFIDIYNDCIGLYQGLGVNYGVGSGYQKVICQYHKFPSLELLEVKYLNDEIKFYNFDNHGTTYEGDAFRFSPSIMNIQSTRNNYTCKGFLRKDDDSFLPWKSFRNNKYGSIGIFTIINDKIFATHCNEMGDRSKKVYNSIVNIGEIGIFNIDGGELISTISSYSSKITDIIHRENNIVVISEKSPDIKFYDDISFELIDKLTLDMSLEILDDNVYSSVKDVYIDTDTRRMAVLYNGIIAIYE